MCPNAIDALQSSRLYDKRGLVGQFSPSFNRFPKVIAARLLAGLALVLSVPATSGCSVLTRNVRAERAFANEDPELSVVLDRQRDCELALALADRLLMQTAYAPADIWPSKIALDGKTADGLSSEVKKDPPYSPGEHEIPTLKVYRLHVERMLKTWSEVRSGPPVYVSVLDAIEADSQGTVRDLKAHYKKLSALLRSRYEAQTAKAIANKKEGPNSKGAALQEAKIKELEGEIAKAKGDMQADIQAIAQAPKERSSEALNRNFDMIRVVSVAFRLIREANLLWSAVSSQAEELYTGAERDFFNKKSEEERLHLYEVSARADQAIVYSDAVVETAEPLLEALSERFGIDMYDTPGFALREGLIEQAALINIDATHARLRGDSELLMFNQLGANAGSGPGYIGMTRRLSYDVDPVVLLGARLIATYDFLYVKNAARINAGFATDRLFGTGGDIQNSPSLGEQLGFEGFASDVFDIGMDIVGLRTKWKSATFTSGTVSEVSVDRATGLDKEILRQAPLQLQFTQLDVGYNIETWLPHFEGKYWLEDMLVGFRYMNYKLPRVLYELSDNDPSPDVTRYVFLRESPAQTVASKLYMGGLALRFGQGERRMFSVFGDVGAYVGAGPASFYFLKEGTQGDSEENRDTLAPKVLVFNGSAGAGLRVRLTPRMIRFRLLLEAQYHAEFVGQTIISAIRETKTEEGSTFTIGKTINYGGWDVYHGPRLQMVAVF